MFGMLLGAGSSVMSQQSQMQQASMSAQQAQMLAKAQMCAEGHRQRQEAEKVVKGLGVIDRQNATIERINGTWRCVIEAPTRIPQHPRQGETQ